MILFLMTCLVLVTTVLSSVSDWRSLRIPNSHVAVITVAFVVAFLAAPESFGPWWSHLGAMAMFLTATYIMFVYGLLGAGDAKFGSALALWVGFKGLVILMFYMAIVGGVLGMIGIFLRRKKPVKNPEPGSFVASVQEGRSAVPYGIAISIGAWAVFFHTGFLHQQLDEVIRIMH